MAGCDAAANALESVECPPGINADAPSPVDAIKALDQLASIPVKGRAPKTGHTRDEFGPAWADVDINGCDTRNDILARDLSNETFKPGTNLMAADGPTNNAKGDKDAATSLPPNKAFRCEYVARQTVVKAKYSLWVTRAEHDAIAGILKGC